MRLKHARNRFGEIRRPGRRTPGGRRCTPAMNGQSGTTWSPSARAAVEGGAREEAAVAAAFAARIDLRVRDDDGAWLAPVGRQPDQPAFEPELEAVADRAHPSRPAPTARRRARPRARPARGSTRGSAPGRRSRAHLRARRTAGGARPRTSTARAHSGAGRSRASRGRAARPPPGAQGSCRCRRARAARGGPWGTARPGVSDSRSRARSAPRARPTRRGTTRPGTGSAPIPGISPSVAQSRTRASCSAAGMCQSTAS